MKSFSKVFNIFISVTVFKVTQVHTYEITNRHHSLNIITLIKSYKTNLSLMNSQFSTGLSVEKQVKSYKSKIHDLMT